jgi:anti-sigma regulatory factor (Ser/Thr protein kinase)
MIHPSGQSLALAIDDASAIGEARRVAMAMAGRLGFDETERGKVAIVATEAASNLSKHAQGGEILIQSWESGDLCGVDLLAIDKGPGMVDVDQCLVDGYSTAGSPGTGLGAMSRLASLLEIHSLPGIGTTVFARLAIAPRTTNRPASDLEFGFVNLPLAGEEVCGDSWAIAEANGRWLLFVVDGLGHGPQAAEAAREAVRVFGETAEEGPAEVIRASHAALRSTRGAAVAVAQVDLQRGEVQYAGVGNISGSIFGPAEGRSLSMVSHNGIVGHTIRKIQEFTYPWISGSLLVMHSDGLGTHWQLDRYPGLARSHPGLVAGSLYRDFKRGRDDVTIVTVREGGEILR